MSVMIKGMDMPESCLKCPFTYEGDCTADAGLTDVYLFLTEHHPDRPLSELPTPHGRLIDADKMLKAIEVMKKNECKTCSSRIDTKRCNRNGCWMMFMSDFINSLPTVIEAEVSE
jgi:hypothetical protein